MRTKTASLLTQVELRLDELTVHLDAATQHVTCGSDDPVEVDLSPGISVLVTNNMQTEWNKDFNPLTMV